MIRTILLVAALCLLLGCGDPDYQEDWLGTWRDTASGWAITFREDGTVGLKVEVAGVGTVIDQAGTPPRWNGKRTTADGSGTVIGWSSTPTSAVRPPCDS